MYQHVIIMAAAGSGSGSVTDPGILDLYTDPKIIMTDPVLNTIKYILLKFLKLLQLFKKLSN
jgi:hypothetical protein